MRDPYPYTLQKYTQSSLSTDFSLLFHLHQCPPSWSTCNPSILLSCFNSNDDKTYLSSSTMLPASRRAPIRSRTKVRTGTDTRQRELKVWVGTIHRHFISLTIFSLSSFSLNVKCKFLVEYWYNGAILGFFFLLFVFHFSSSGTN